MTMLLIPFLAALIASLAITPLVRFGARRIGWIAPPSADRWHRKPTALFGGVAIYAALGVGLWAAFALWTGDIASPIPEFGSKGWGIVVSASIMFVLGLIDDRLRLRPTTKLIVQGVAGATLVSFGVVYALTPWPSVNVVVTFFWFLALTNALNLLDNMDAVAAGVAGLAAIFLALTFAQDGAWMLAIVCAALAGATAGFLPYNFHPASIFMGDSGSLFMGALLAGLGAAYPGVGSGSIASVLFVPVFIVIIPIVDTVLVTVTRTVAGRPVSLGGRDHTSHRLVAMGLSERKAAMVLFAFAAIGGALATALRMVATGYGLWIGLIFLIGLAVFAAYLTRLHTYSGEERRRSHRVTKLVSNLLYKRRALEIMMDIALFAAAYYGAYLLLFDGSVPAPHGAVLERTLALAVATKMAVFGLAGVYRGIWQHLSISDVHRLVLGAVLGMVVTALVLAVASREAPVATSVILLDGMLVLLFTIGARASFRSLELLRHELTATGGRALVYGAGQGGVIAVRELLSNPEWGLQPVGFLDDDGAKHGFLVHGLPVLGGAEQLPGAVERRKADTLVIATRKIDKARLDRVIAKCQSLGLRITEFEVRMRAIEAPERPLMRRASGERRRISTELKLEKLL